MAGVENFFSNLFGGSNSDDAGHYTEAVRRGGAVVTVTVEDETKVDAARSALASVGAVNIEEHMAAWRNTGYTGYQKNSPPFTAGQVAEERARVIPVIQEDLEVGKRQVDMGAVRIVSRLVETPVSENVTLREEHATIELRPVDRPATEADLSAAQSIEVRVTA
ncbi:YsnF/AvaK domain-containing protein [Noviherbaspirillum sp. L7-7A]|nr:YsnF/AvaK domain-containing protein [Noviherbaspirillum sp. L7-7A]